MAKLAFTLEQLKPEHGMQFERFANSFLSTEFEDLRPVGGLHDEGRDAFIMQQQDEPKVFIQSSLQKKWQRKIADTLTALEKNGHDCQTLVYCTNLAIQGEADELKKKLRKEGVILDIRDSTYFTALSETSIGKQRAGELLYEQIAAPLIASRKLSDDVRVCMTDEEERIALAYLQLEMSTKESEKSLLKFSVETFVLHSLFQAENPVEEVVIQEKVRSLLPIGDQDQLKNRVEGAIKRLIKQNKVRTEEANCYCLTNKERRNVEAKMADSLDEYAMVSAEVASRVLLVSESLEINFEFSKEDVADDVLRVIEFVLFDKGRQAAEALASNEFFTADTPSITDVVENCIMIDRISFRSFDSLGMANFLDLIPCVAADVLVRPSDTIAKRLTRIVDAYCLMFVVRQTPDVQRSINKIVAGNTLLVDASVIVACMAEQAYSRARRPLTNLLRAVRELGARLVIHEHTVNEVHHHLRVIRLRFREFETGVPGNDGDIIDAYRNSELELGTFENFIERFEGNVQPQEDLQEFLDYEFNLQLESFEGKCSPIDPAELEDLVSKWKATKRIKTIRTDEATDVLVRHDANALLLIEKLREKAESRGSVSGYEWWLLTLDRAAYRMDILRRKSTARNVSACMSPDYFARYLSILPKARSADEIIPLSINAAAIDVIPVEAMEEARDIMKGMANEPTYLRRRRLRDLANKAKGRMKVPHNNSLDS